VQVGGGGGGRLKVPKGLEGAQGDNVHQEPEAHHASHFTFQVGLGPTLLSAAHTD
jgi:hypothetical protein